MLSGAFLRGLPVAAARLGRVTVATVEQPSQAPSTALFRAGPKLPSTSTPAARHGLSALRLPGDDPAGRLGVPRSRPPVPASPWSGSCWIWTPAPPAGPWCRRKAALSALTSPDVSRVITRLSSAAAPGAGLQDTALTTVPPARSAGPLHRHRSRTCLPGFCMVNRLPGERVSPPHVRRLPGAQLLLAPLSGAVGSSGAGLPARCSRPGGGRLAGRPPHPTRPTARRAVAVDGKSLRRAARTGSRKIHLLAALDQQVRRR